MNLLRRFSPRLSVILIVHAMPDQATRTLRSLSRQYQKGVRPADYEVIVVENTSDHMLGGDSVRTLGKNFRYCLNEAPGVSPAAAVNLGVARSRARHVAVMVDGARMLTPGVIRHTLEAIRLDRNAVVSVPGYHLGAALQQETADSGYSQNTEQELLKQIGWPDDGYRLFDIACLSGSCAHGFFNPVAESNFLCIPRDLFNKIGGCDLRFDLPGGGLVNLDLYKRVAEHPGIRLFILPGEGTFHQFHGGVTTGQDLKNRDALLDAMRRQYETIRGERFQPPRTPATYLGELSPPAQAFVHLSAEKALARRTDIPRLSVVVVIHRMARQAGNTLFTLSTAYQRHVRPEEYEVIVVENRSDDMLGPEAVRAVASNFHYFEYVETGVSPVSAMNFGCAQARAPFIGLMIDGARMLTPRVIEYAFLAQRMTPRPLVGVPGYHLGDQEQSRSLAARHDEPTEAALLAGVDWRADGYRLLDIGCFSPGNRNGFFLNMFECNCLFCTRGDLCRVGGLDERFQSPGGGMANLDLFKRLMELPDTRFMIMPGEGSFHQFHGGVTTRETGDNQALYDSFKKEYETIRGGPFHIQVKEPLLLGAVNIHAQRFVHASSANALEKAGKIRP